MIIREALLAEHSKRQTMKIVRYIGDDREKFAELMRHFLGPVYRLSQRAAWAVGYCAELHPELVRPYFGRMVSRLEAGEAHPAVRRNVARMLQFIDIPERYQARVYEACLALVEDPSEPVAVRCFSMSAAAKIAEQSPDLMSELRLVVDSHAAGMSAGLLSRARRLSAQQ